jgi:hypothetical protein
MASSKISVIIDVAVDQANRGLKSFRQSIQDADGAAGKFKAGTSSAFDAVKANAGNLAMAGGAALVAFGVKAVGAFQDTALEAGRLAESLGLTSEQASRLMEVSGDLGIDMGTVEKAIGKMNIEVAKSPKYFDEIGAAIAKNADGTTDVQQTFLNVVDAINKMPNATDRAAASQKLLGRGWKDMAELVGQGSEKLSASLGAVSDAKVIDEAEVKKAREFRDAMDKLKDASEDLMLVVGGELVPVLTDIADVAGVVTDIELPDWMSKVGEAADSSLNPLKKVFDIFGDWKDLGPVDEWIGLTEAVDNSTDATRRYEEEISRQSDASAIQAARTDEATEAVEDSTEAIDESWEALERQREAQEAANNAILEGLNSSLAYRNQQARTNETIAASAAVLASGTASTDEMAQAARDAEGAVMDQAAAAVRLAEDQAGANGQTLTAEQKAATYKAELEKLAGFLTGDARIAIQMYIDSLNRIPRRVDTAVNFAGGGGSLAVGGKRALGGPVSPGSLYEVGEGGKAELFEQNGRQYLIPGDRGMVTPARGSGSGGASGAGMVVHLTVNAGLGTNGAQLGRQLVDVLEAHYRNGGRPPRSG